MSRRSIVGALGLALVLILLPATLVEAAGRGTDMWQNLAPGGAGGLADKYPISYYSLDYHVDGPSVGLSGVDAGDVPALVAQFLASLIFTIVTFFMKVTISAFDWAFSVDIIGGRHGALRPVGSATKNLWTSTFLPFMSTGVLMLAGWFVYKMLGRRFGEAGAGLLRATCLAAVALVIIFNPGGTIGTASSLVNGLSSAIASGTTGGNGGQDVSDRMFDTFIYKPWVVLEFGGLRHCVDWSHKDSEGFPRPARNSTATGSRECRDHVKSHNGRGGYAERFLHYPPGSRGRNREYAAISKGEVPGGNGPDGDLAGSIGLTEPIDTHQFDGYQVDKADAPAADMMQAQGAVQRLAFVALLSVGIISAILLLGLICFASLFVQLGLLVCLAAAPAMAIAAIFPGLHGIFFTWAKWVGKFLVAKVMYAILLSAAIGVSAALMSVGGSMGYLPVFALQTALFLGLFLKRKALAEQLTSRREYNKSENSSKTFIAGAAAAAVGVVSAPVAAAGAAGAAAKSRLDTVKQQHAKDPDTQDAPAAQASSGSKAPSTSQPAPTREPSVTIDNITNDQSTTYQPAKEESPVALKSFQDDYEQAKVDRQPAPRVPPEKEFPGVNTPESVVGPQQRAERELERDRNKPLDPAPRASNGAGRVESFDQALARAREQERAKTPST